MLCSKDTHCTFVRYFEFVCEGKDFIVDYGLILADFHLLFLSFSLANFYVNCVKPC